MDLDTLLAVLGAGRVIHDGEPVDLLAHSLQCAALLADRMPDDRELHVAGLVHDIGTALEPDRPETHATTGAAVVRPLFGDRVAWLVERHTDAKRYLVSTDSSYRSRLSARSAVTLAAQGGMLDAGSIAALDAAPDRDALLSLRRADDDAKMAGWATADLERWRPLLVAMAASPGTG